MKCRDLLCLRAAAQPQYSWNWVSGSQKRSESLESRHGSSCSIVRDEGDWLHVSQDWTSIFYLSSHCDELGVLSFMQSPPLLFHKSVVCGKFFMKETQSSASVEWNFSVRATGYTVWNRSITWLVIGMILTVFDRPILLALRVNFNNLQYG